MDRTVVRKTTLKEQDEAFCLALSIDERLKVLEELNRIGRLAAGYPEARLLETTILRVVYGSYASDEEAQQSLKDLRSQSRQFREAWVMKVNQ